MSLMRMRERDGGLYFPTCDVPLTPVEVEEQYNLLAAEVDRLRSNAPAAGPFTDLSNVVEGKRYLLKYRDRTGNVRICDGAFKTVRNQRTGELLTEQWTHPHDMMGLICFPEDAIAVAELNGDAT